MAPAAIQAPARLPQHHGLPATSRCLPVIWPICANGAQEHLVAALRCLYRRAVDDGLIAEADNPAP